MSRRRYVLWSARTSSRSPGRERENVASNLAETVRSKILGDAEAHRALAPGARHHVARFFRERQQPPRIGQQPLAGFGRRHILAVAVQQRLADIVFQPLDLLADGRLRAVDAFAGAGEAAGIDDGNETAQELQIEHANAPFINPLEISLSFNFQISRRRPT